MASASPLLVFPLDHQEKTQENIIKLFLYSLKTQKFYSVNGLKNLHDYKCIGSSHGWLAFLDQNSNPFLFNPFSTTRIDLPKKQTLPTKGFGSFSASYVHKIDKIILSRSPSHDEKISYVAIVMYSVLSQTKIAFCRHGDRQWSPLESEFETCCDVVCCDQTNTVLALGPGPAVEPWDFNKLVPRKKMTIRGSCPRKLAQSREEFPDDLYASQWYLALSSGQQQIFLVARYIGEFVRYDGEVVREGDTLTDYASEPLVCPYKTVGFHVFKIDCDRKEWIEVGSLGDFSMFLGGNQSMMVCTKGRQGLKENCIYFTDDYLDGVDEDNSYGGHDIGIFNMKDASIEPIMECQEQRIEPPPVWISLPRDHISI